jgi:two-component sensor histidine kinase
MASGANQQVHAFFETHGDERIKARITAVLTLFIIVLTIVSTSAGIEIVFTHIFYIPIIVVTYWYRVKGIIYTVALSAFYLGTVSLMTGSNPSSLVPAFGRVIMFISIATVVAVLSEMIHRQKAELVMVNDRLQESNRTLEEKERQMRTNLEELTQSERNLLASREQISNSLKERESLLKEIHHRVRNNLQIVISLLNLQARHVTDQKLLDVIRESQNRVRMMAFAHEQLYRSGDVSHIDMGDYIAFLTRNLFASYGVEQSQVTSSIRIKGPPLDIGTAIPVGLICNEVISNSLRHAFPDGRKGEITIMAEHGPECIVLTVGDNGIGMPEGLDWKNADTLGLRLVSIFAQQFNGTISLKRNGGTVWEITIPQVT